MRAMELSPYLNFNGQCAAAFKFYEQCLGGKIVMMQTHGESPMKDQVPPDWRDKVIHARLRNAFSTRWQRAETSACRFRKPSGPPVLAWLSTGSARRGW